MKRAAVCVAGLSLAGDSDKLATQAAARVAAALFLVRGVWATRAGSIPPVTHTTRPCAARPFPAEAGHNGRCRLPHCSSSQRRRQLGTTWDIEETSMTAPATTRAPRSQITLAANAVV